MKITIVGSGLIGTSMGLSLRGHGHLINFEDIEPAQKDIAQDLVGSRFEGESDLVVIATPAVEVFAALKSAYEANPQSKFIEISGLKSELLREVDKISGLREKFCATHPMAGREISGATAARADLFEGRTWILTPGETTSPEVIQVAKTIISQMGATVLTRTAGEHDRAIALVSHLPQVLSSLTASALVGKDQKDIDLSGQGLRDVSRLGESSPELWRELLISNRAELLPLLKDIENELSKLISNIDHGDKDAVGEFLRKGNLGRSYIPGKHGGKQRDYSYLPIVIDDKPGQLAKIVDECARANVNIEDLNIEHSPGQETGLITLALSREDAEVLHAQLQKNGWRVHEAFTR